MTLMSDQRHDLALDYNVYRSRQLVMRWRQRHVLNFLQPQVAYPLEPLCLNDVTGTNDNFKTKAVLEVM